VTLGLSIPTIVAPVASAIGDIIALLASDDSRWVNGQVIDATGAAYSACDSSPSLSRPVLAHTRALVEAHAVSRLSGTCGG
jgi:hypothetical protein